VKLAETRSKKRGFAGASPLATENFENKLSEARMYEKNDI